MRYYLDYFYDQVGASVVYDMIAFALIITLPLIIKTKDRQVVLVPNEMCKNIPGLPTLLGILYYQLNFADTSKLLFLG